MPIDGRPSVATPARLSATQQGHRLPSQGPQRRASEIREGFVRWPTVLASAFAVLLLGVGSARAQISDDVVKIGVMNDQSGLYADLGGPGSVVAARMAAEDAGGSVLGKPIEIVAADHQNKADIGVA